MTDRIAEDLRFYQAAIQLRQQRQEVLAANIANADTPGYKARDIDFAASLREVLDGNAGLPPLVLQTTSARHISMQASAPRSAELAYRQPYQRSLDGNTVEMEAERMQFADNTQRYQADLTLISQRIKTMMAALQP